MSLISINPYDLSTLNIYKIESKKSAINKIMASHSAHQSWQASTNAQRKTLALNMAKQIRLHKDELAIMATKEMGKPLTQSYMEVEKCASICEYYAQELATILSPKINTNKPIYNAVHYNSMGVVMGIMPWNFPYWQVIRNCIPVLLGGNAYVLKHANNVYGCATLIEAILKKAGIENNLFQLLFVDGFTASQLIAHPKIAAVSFTGSSKVGRIIAAQCGAHLKKCVLELGGNDGYAILEDANIKQAIQASTYSRLINNGQSCIAAKRFIVHANHIKEFTNGVLAKMASVVIGDPMDKTVTLGPLARLDLKNNLYQQVQKSIKKGAKALNNIAVPRQGLFYPPLVLSQVTPGMPAFDEELFGPVSSIVIANSDVQAINLVNNSQYGLGAAVFTKNKKKALHITTKQLQAGSCFANDFVRSVTGMPFGGTKQSGLGRELGPWGILEFMHVKNVCVY
jgi:succinate-semialdehyde dehydrogenase / glutarate-semialdehyde dehydrogenase